MIKIRLADWRDREDIQPIRRLINRPIDGGLYELLNWSNYHVHTALKDDRTVGFTSVFLFGDEVADDTGTHSVESLPEVVSMLRRTQVRDLQLMGWKVLYSACPPELIELYRTHFGEPLCSLLGPEGDCYYFGDTIDSINQRMRELGIPDPFPLSPHHVEKLTHKAIRAKDDFKKLELMASFQVQKGTARKL